MLGKTVFQGVINFCVPVICGLLFSLPIKGGEKDSDIVGGEPADEPYSYYGTFSYVDSTTEPICGAALIDEQWALTAAHCTDYFDDIDEVEMIFNLHKASDQGEGYRVEVDQTIEHPHEPDHIHDISLVRLEEPVPKEPLYLPAKKDTGLYQEGTEVKGMGFGIKDPDEKSKPDTLQVANFPIVSDEACYSKGRDIAMDIDYNFCAGSREDTLGNSEGDSGSPIVVEKDGRKYLVGISIGGAKSYTTPELPGMFMRVNVYNEWITNTMKKEDGVISSIENEKSFSVKVGQKPGELIFYRGKVKGRIEGKAFTRSGQKVMDFQIQPYTNQKSISTQKLHDHSVLILQARSEKGKVLNKKVPVEPY